MKLTVAIPTYDRNATLLRNLSFLLPLLTDDCQLLILDNYSPTPVAATLQKLFGEFPTVRIRVERNRTNIGAAANILRCFELCETEWIWILSDDDRPRPDAITTIFRETIAHPESIFLNFSSAFSQRLHSNTTKGLDDFVRQLDEFGNIVFISTSIFRTAPILSCLKFGYLYTYSWAPHVAALLYALGEDAEVGFLSDRLVEYVEGDEKRWSYINWGLGMGTLLDVPMKTSTRKVFAERIWRSVPCLDLALVIELTAAQNIEHMQLSEVGYLYRQICQRLYSLDRNPLRWLRRFGVRLMLGFPRVSYRLCIAAIRFSRRRSGRSDNVEGVWAPRRQ
jgi:glycosyltransferase involved in cell wall biosynthesis